MNGEQVSKAADNSFVPEWTILRCKSFKIKGTCCLPLTLSFPSIPIGNKIFKTSYKEYWY